MVAARIELTTAESAVESTTAPPQAHRARRRAKTVHISICCGPRNIFTNDHPVRLKTLKIYFFKYHTYFYTLAEGIMISVRSLQRSCKLLTEINIPSARV